jgi:hypothetical protein
MDLPWASSAPALLAATDNQTFVEGMASTRLSAPSGALNVFVEFVPAKPLNLGSFEELRFWIRSNRSALGTTAEPFYLQFSFTDNGDGPGETHRWLLPINQNGKWEQRRIGIGNERRTAIGGFRLTCLTDLPFICHVDELLAVNEDMVADVEEALARRLDQQIALPSATNVLLAESAAVNDTQVVVPINENFAAGNLIILRGGAAEETHTVTAVNHNQATGRTTLNFGPGDKIRAVMRAGIASASILVPVITWIPPEEMPATTPAILITLTDAREDLDRTGSGTQRDSFRLRGTLTVCSVRPAARAYALTYQITIVGPQRAQYLLIHNRLLQLLSTDIPLRINGYPSPVWILPAPATTGATTGPVADTIVVRIGTRMELSPREERPWVRRADIEAAQMDTPLDQEGIVLQL